MHVKFRGVINPGGNLKIPAYTLQLSKCTGMKGGNTPPLSPLIVVKAHMHLNLCVNY